MKFDELTLANRKAGVKFPINLPKSSISSFLFWTHQNALYFTLTLLCTYRRNLIINMLGVSTHFLFIFAAV